MTRCQLTMRLSVLLGAARRNNSLCRRHVARHQPRALAAAVTSTSSRGARRRCGSRFGPAVAAGFTAARCLPGTSLSRPAGRGTRRTITPTTRRNSLRIGQCGTALGPARRVSRTTLRCRDIAWRRCWWCKSCCEQPTAVDVHNMTGRVHDIRDSTGVHAPRPSLWIARPQGGSNPPPTWGAKRINASPLCASR